MKQIFCLAIISIILKFGHADKYLIEKPSFLQPCGLNDPGFGKCLAINLQKIFSEWKNGVPGLKSFGKWDPLFVKKVKIVQDNSNILSLNMILENILVSGISKVTVSEAKLDTRSWIVNAKLFAPRLEFDSDYKTKGTVLSIPLNSQGKTKFFAENVDIDLIIHCKLRTDGDFTFTDIKMVKANIAKISNFHLHIDNLFHGQKDLEESTNKLLNAQWPELYQVLRPAIQQTIELTLDDKFKKLFHYVPANYFIYDIPKV